MKDYNRILNNKKIISILEVLRKKSLSFSKLLDQTDIRDRGHLSYYLKILIKEGLVDKSREYSLTKEGDKFGVYLRQFKSNEMYPIPVVCVIYLEGGKILLARRANSPYRGFWSFPGGRVLLGEALEDSAVRIAREDLGIGIKVKKVSGVYPTVVYHKKSLIYHVLLIPVIVQKKGGKVNFDENDVELKFFDLKKIPRVKMVPPDKEIIRNLQKSFTLKEQVVR